MEASPDGAMIPHPQIQDYERSEYPQYDNYIVQMGNDEPCRKTLPNKQSVEDTPSSMSHSKKASRMKDRSSGKKRVMFEDQKRQNSGIKAKNQVKKDLFKQSESKYESSAKQTSQGYGSESEPQTLEKYPNKSASYDHFHDESMSKLEAVLQRQRERLENLGGFSGKSSQISQNNDNEQNLEEAYQDLENEIYNIKRNLEASQNSEGMDYTPYKESESHANRRSGHQDGMSLSPSELEQDDEGDFHPKFK